MLLSISLYSFLSFSSLILLRNLTLLGVTSISFNLRSTLLCLDIFLNFGENSAIVQIQVNRLIYLTEFVMYGTIMVPSVNPVRSAFGW